MNSVLEKAGNYAGSLRDQVAAAVKDSSRAPDGTLVLSRRAQIAIVVLASAAMVAVIVVSLLLHALFASRGETTQSSVNGQNGLKLTPAQMEYLKIEPVKQMPFRSQQTTEGAIAFDDDLSTPVFSPYSGRVAHLFAAAGDEVKRGAPLMSVEASEIVQAQDDLASSANALATAKAQLNLAETDAKRQRELYEAKGAALKDMQASEVALIDARGKYQSAETDLAAVRNRLRILGQSDGQIAELERSPQNPHMKAEAVIAAPIAGTVIQRQIGPGQFIQANGANPVYVIGDLSKVWLIANVRESELATVKLGDDVEVTVPAFPGRTFNAHIAYIAAALDPNTHRLPVRAEVENPDRALKPQMFASFRIATGNEAMGIGVPENAVVYDADAAHVWVVDKDKVLKRRTVKLGRRQNGLLEITDGLIPGEEVVTDGPLFMDHAALGD